MSARIRSMGTIGTHQDAATRWRLDDGTTIEVRVWETDGSDGCIVVQIDTTFEPDEMLRINVNDGHVFGPEYQPREDTDE